MMRAAAVGALGAMLLAGAALGGAGEAAPPRHLIYLHGRIVQEQQSERPRHPKHGYYEVARILEAFRQRGFVVSGRIRPRSATVSGSADEVVRQVRELIESGVRPDHITVVGGSMGAAIALVASARLQQPEVRFGLLGDCLSRSVRGLLEPEGGRPSGRLLSIREASDSLTEPCTPWKEAPGSAPSLAVREIVLKTGLDHGFLYRPLPEWVDPIVHWAGTAR